MPTTTGGLPYPAYSDAPDIPGGIQALAEAVDTTKAGATHTHAEADVTSLTADLAGKASTSHTHTTLPNRTVRMDRTSANTDVDGYITVSHGGASTPIGMICSIETQSDYRCVPSTRTSTTFRVRVFGPTGAPAASRSVAISWMAIF